MRCWRWIPAQIYGSRWRRRAWQCHRSGGGIRRRLRRHPAHCRVCLTSLSTAISFRICRYSKHLPERDDNKRPHEHGPLRALFDQATDLILRHLGIVRCIAMKQGIDVHRAHTMTSEGVLPGERRAPLTRRISTTMRRVADIAGMFRQPSIQARGRRRWLGIRAVARDMPVDRCGAAVAAD